MYGVVGCVDHGSVVASVLRITFFPSETAAAIQVLLLQSWVGLAAHVWVHISLSAVAVRGRALDEMPHADIEHSILAYAACARLSSPSLAACIKERSPVLKGRAPSHRPKGRTST
eukprot:1157988-Pelagomonas_calceolata.AAC.5